MPRPEIHVRQAEIAIGATLAAVGTIFVLRELQRHDAPAPLRQDLEHLQVTDGEAAALVNQPPLPTSREFIH